MNLLSNNSSSDRNKYVIDMMRKNKLETITVANNKKNYFKFFTSKKNYFYVIFMILSLAMPVTLFTNGNLQFVVNADKLNVVAEPLSQTSNTEIAVDTIPLTPKERKNVVSSYVIGDKRALALKKFLDSQKSPLAEVSSEIVTNADKYGVDYTLLVSISGIESGFCRVTTMRMDNPDLESHNCWGWGKNGNRFWEFNSWAEGVQRVTRGISEVYGNNPTPEEMQDMYCHSCRGDDRWKSGVRDYMNDIKKIEREI
ncbi:MAG: hypothetical protein WCJ19_00830 [bacterium]